MDNTQAPLYTVFVGMVNYHISIRIIGFSKENKVYA